MSRSQPTATEAFSQRLYAQFCRTSRSAAPSGGGWMHHPDYGISDIAGCGEDYAGSADATATLLKCDPGRAGQG